MIENLKITLLSENCSNKSELSAEHGFSLYIEADNQKIIFDTGASELYIENGEKLGIDFTAVEAVVLSHGHYDHVGGLAKIGGQNIYCHKDIFLKKYKYEHGRYKDIGIAFSEAAYSSNNNLEINYVDKEHELFPDVLLLTDFQKKEQKNYFYIVKNNKFVADDFADELIMTFNTNKGLVIITGCAHSGIVNIIERALAVNKTKNIYALLGGFHLSKLTEQENKQVAEKINEYNIDNIGISHCTGGLLKKHLLAKNAFNFNVGDSFLI